MPTRSVCLALALSLVGALSAHAEILTGATDPACQAAAAYSDARRGAEILVLKDGRPICETYAGEGAPDHAMELWSGTKSFSGLLAAAAVQDGLLTLDEPVAKTLPEWRDDPRKAKATIRHLLSLTVGIRSAIGRPPEYADAIRMPLEADPGQVFIYGPAPYQVFGEVMKRKLAAAGQPADPYLYLKRRVLDPIGVGEMVWRRTPGGDPLMPQGAELTARQWAKVGEFVRAGGKVAGKAIVDPATFRALFVGSTANPAYGLTWWLPHAPKVADPVSETADFALNADRLPADLVVAAGAGDQRLYVIPSCGLTIVRLARLDIRALMARRGGAGDWSDTAFLTLLLGQS
ncbi:serine hydrolase [Phenylobacterium aquaticum]|uniref:serine hydrolase domain-containing protein n=1 Tax=Phenylobacterium aquaticum TaxID=1763816 RepID=UPI0026F04966|nr:serine hydrolase domain-containing protein [Phenylobacterium aquaticum]